MGSAGKVGVVERAWAFPLSRLASGSGVWCRIGLRNLSRVRDRSEFLGAGDCPRPDLVNPATADPVLFRLAPDEWVLSGSLPELSGLNSSFCCLGSALVASLQNGHFPHHLVESSGWRSGCPLVQYPTWSSDWQKYLLDFRKQVSYPSRVLYEDGDGLFGGFWVSFFPQLIVQLGFGHHFARMPNEFPDLLEDHRLFRVVLPDFFVLLFQFLRHGRHLCVEVRVIRLGQVELPLYLLQLLPGGCPLGNFPDDVSGSASS
jgi:hypothetical protein